MKFEFENLVNFSEEMLKSIARVGGRYSEWASFLYKHLIKELIKQVFPILWIDTYLFFQNLWFYYLNSLQNPSNSKNPSLVPMVRAYAKEKQKCMEINQALGTEAEEVETH